MLYTAFNLPYVIWMMRGYIEDIPLELEECALVDGCTRWEVLRKVVFPMARSGLFATAVFTFVFAWNDFLFALVLTRTEVTTFTVQVTHYFGGQSNFWAKIAAMCGARHRADLHRRGDAAALPGARHLAWARSRAERMARPEDHAACTNTTARCTPCAASTSISPTGEFTVLVGPSGCGKSTLLRTIAGLEEASGGTIEIGGESSTHAPARPRHRHGVPELRALSLYERVREHRLRAAGAQVRRSRDRAAGDARRRHAGHHHLLQRLPRQLSGGQRQRVAIGRAIVRNARLFLFDEPLSNLDAQLRDGMRSEIKRLHQELGKTMIYVTHDQIEAMTLADRIVLLKDGVIEQQGARSTCSSGRPPGSSPASSARRR